MGNSQMSEHREDGKLFTSMKAIGPVVTEKSARQWEGERLAQYRRNHGGRNPEYNKTNKEGMRHG